jgi:polyvinyl alcohol dehydrogenase (cytochrome)
MKIVVRLAAVVAVLLAGQPALAQPAPVPPSPAAPSAAGQPANPRAALRALGEGAGARLFGDICQNCHGNPEVRGAMSPASMKLLTPERIYQALSTGPMKSIADGQKLSDQQRIDIAQWVGGRRMGATESGAASKMTNRCTTNPAFSAAETGVAWNGWGGDLTNKRFQGAQGADLSPGQVTRLKLKWAFALPGAITVDGQPTIVGGRVFVSADTGWVYSLDANTGCVYWSFQAASQVRSATTVGPLKPGSDRYGVFFGDVKGRAYAIDATSGDMLWSVLADDQPLARITGGTTLHNGRLYVPVASMEEPEANSPNYKCCTFRGLVAALDAETGKHIWKAYTIEETPTQRKNAKGVTFFGPSGAGVWNRPTIDVKRNAIYFGTGNNFSDPSTNTSDAVFALDLTTGKRLWVTQLWKDDVWHVGCTTQTFGVPPGGAPAIVERSREVRSATYYCPDPRPDWDLSSSPMLARLSDGRELVVASPKSGIVFALDPDKGGATLWKQDVNRTVPGSGGNILFGGATDGEHAYYNLREGAVVAVDLAAGVEKWYKPIAPQASMADFKGFTAALTAIPGVIFSSGLDGMVRALATRDGSLLWQFNTAQEFRTVNGVNGRGGSLGSAGVTVANGMVFVPSGYTGWQGGSPGNLLLAFTPYDRIVE